MSLQTASLDDFIGFHEDSSYLEALLPVQSFGLHIIPASRIKRIKV
jgi:hypothetical protein